MIFIKLFLVILSYILNAECSEEHPCEGLGVHAHYKNFGMAFLTLFRVATGDNWNGIMKVIYVFLQYMLLYNKKTHPLLPAFCVMVQ